MSPTASADVPPTRVPSGLAAALLFTLAACAPPPTTEPGVDEAALATARMRSLCRAGDSDACARMGLPPPSTPNSAPDPSPDPFLGSPPTKTCEAQVAAAPTALFGETVLIRPPLNVELNDENPTMAVGVVSGGFISACEATVDRMTLLVFENDKTKSAEAFANEFVDDYLAKGGYTDGVKSEPIVDTNDDFDVSVEYPAAGGQPASTLYVAVRKRRGDLFAIVYQTRPGDYPVLKASFTKSAASLLVSPRRGCCRVCTVGRSCGDGCIASHLQCDQPRGCACDG